MPSRARVGQGSIVRTALAAVILCCCGCLGRIAPANDLPLARVATIRAFEGAYRNLGESGPGAGPRYLTQIIWPASDLDHKAIELVRVEALADTTLRVTAESAGAAVKVAEFVEGKDFHLRDGAIELKRGFQGSLAYPSGNPFIGIMHQNRVLGVDEAGNAKLIDEGKLAGTAFLVIPVLGGAAESVRFARERNR